jgi:hypothetical protein
MGKFIKITESQLRKIIDIQINEQKATLTPTSQGVQQPLTSITTATNSGTINPTNVPTNNPKTQVFDATKKYPCINNQFALSYQYLLEQKKYDKQFLKAALSIIGRESSFASGKRYNVLNVLKTLASVVGVDTSVGPAQMKSSTGKEFGIDSNTLTTNTGALDAAYRYLKKYYNLAIKNGYSPNQPSSVGQNGTGSAALDITIASYNKGLKIITQWCKTTDPKICVECSSITQGAKIIVPNYIPNFTSERVDLVNTSTRGYLKEVAGYYKKMTC